MAEHIKAGLISKVVVYRLDRLSRSLKDLALFMDMLKEKEVKFYSITENFDTTSPMGQAMLSIMGVFAQMEREVISQRITHTKAKQMADGIKLGPPPFGYRIKIGSRNRWKIIPSEAKIVRKVFSMYATGKWSYQSIAAYLNGTVGRPERKREPGVSGWGRNEYAKQGWQAWTIKCIVRQATYAGIVSTSPFIRAENLKPIISYQLFKQCEQIRQERNPRSPDFRHATTNDYPLKGRLFCCCGFKMYGSRKKTRHLSQKLYYWCRNIRHGKSKPYVAASVVLNEILDYLKTCKFDTKLISETKRKFSSRETLEAERMKIIKNLQKSYERLQERYIDGAIGKTFLQKKEAEIKKKLEELKPKTPNYGRIVFLAKYLKPDNNSLFSLQSPPFRINL